MPSETKFGFTVRRCTPEGSGNGLPESWSVYLPHQCQEWDITGEWDPVPHGQAVAELEAFIAEAQQALEALRAGRQYGEVDDVDD